MPKTHNDSPLKMSRNPMDVKSEKKQQQLHLFRFSRIHWQETL